MVALIDTPVWRLLTALVGGGVAIVGLVFLQFGISRLGWAPVTAGSVLALWAWLHKTRGRCVRPVEATSERYRGRG
jgi:hypothetical protein